MSTNQNRLFQYNYFLATKSQVKNEYRVRCSDLILQRKIFQGTSTLKPEFKIVNLFARKRILNLYGHLHVRLYKYTYR